MKLNIDCMRAILLEVENVSYGKSLPFQSLVSELPNYSTDDISYSVLKLKEAEYIKASTLNADNTTMIIAINDITYNGHQFLESIRDNNVWKKTKAIASKIGATSVSAITQIASSVVASIIKSTLGI